MKPTQLTERGIPATTMNAHYRSLGIDAFDKQTSHLHTMKPKSNTILYGNTYLDPDAHTTPDSENAILEAFPNLVNPDTSEVWGVLLPDDCTNAEFHAACVSASLLAEDK